MGMGDQRHAPAALTSGKTAVWATGSVWTGAENLAPTGIRSPCRPARGQSLYCLRYPVPTDNDRKKTEVLEVKPDTVPICPNEITHGMTWDRTRDLRNDEARIYGNKYFKIVYCVIIFCVPCYYLLCIFVTWCVFFAVCVYCCLTYFSYRTAG